MNGKDGGTALVLLEAAAINYARWQMAYSAGFHSLPADKLDEARRAGDESRRQLSEAALRFAGEGGTLLDQLLPILGWSGGTIHAALAEVRAVISQRDEYRRQLAAERERGEHLESLMDDTRRANDSLRAQIAARETSPGLERP